MTSLRYNYIVIEGNIGTGKTSLATRLAAEHDAKLILERLPKIPFYQNFMKTHRVLPFRWSFLSWPTGINS